MERYDELYALYETFDTDTLRAYQDFIDLFPPVDSRVALEYWEEASDELAQRRDSVADAHGETYASLAAHATREQAFTALDLHSKHGRPVNVLVLDVDETLRSAGSTDNEIPRETLHLLTVFHEHDVPIVVCTGQTLENVKGFLNQGLGNEFVHSGEVSVVYEAGSGVFTPGHGSETKRLLYEDLDERVRDVFGYVRSRVLRDAPERVRRGCHLQGNEFNVTLKPNHETGSDAAVEIIDEAIVYVTELLAAAIDDATPADVRAYYATRDPEIAAVLDEADALPEGEDVPEDVGAVLDRVQLAYYEGDAAEVTARELDKVAGVEAALDVLGIDDPFTLVMGDSKSDLRVMEWAEANDAGIAAAPEHASTRVLDHVRGTDGLTYARGAAGNVLRTVYALNRLADGD
ncbi:hydroxymethylpyrimidine pyrophosphatase-like HAD family hydrolase [Halarchaeum rubridurum]|uniref:Haloacid dehalogenase n=1 Tax=Halarchaeum rubridurum TaxID=489911 RepID=A0A830G1T7_9EURY|nr:HAD family hydrolase [Halarchaeum rubridurum]MBP1955332.1 hydroxymethylpyrimidine pyrophosphatase-like HAD family hydrolase [Halarchaeum rubridurum]GGM71560.1 haloacid dehalogenase [Halarchaeum rubridurum]